MRQLADKIGARIGKHYPGDNPSKNRGLLSQRAILVSVVVNNVDRHTPYHLTDPINGCLYNPVGT